MLSLEFDTVEKWLEDAETFSYEFMRYSMINYRAAGMDVTFDRPAVEAAHAEWQATVSHWQNHLFRRDTESLSYIKIFAILLWCLSKQSYIQQIRTYSAGARRSEYEFNGDEKLREALVEDFLGAPEVICAIDFCMAVIGAYEEARTDRLTPYVWRLTKSFRHDLIVVLTGGEINPQHVYVMLEANFARA